MGHDTLNLVRGVLAYPTLRFPNNTLLFSFLEAKANLRFQLTYFDKVCLIPCNTGFLNFCSEEEQLLVEQEILTYFPKRLVSFEESMYQAFENDAKNVLNYQNRDVAPFWSLYFGGWMNYEFDNEEKNSLSLDFFSCLPCPSVDMPIHEVIGFRKDNIDDFTQFHLYLESVLEKIEQGSVQGAKKDIKEICDYLDYLENKFVKSKLSFLKFDFSVKRSIVSGFAAAGAAAVCANLGFDPVAGAGISAFATERVCARLASSPYAINDNSFPKNFEYVGRLRRELNYNKELVDREYNADIERVLIQNSALLIQYPKIRMAECKSSDILINNISLQAV